MIESKALDSIKDKKGLLLYVPISLKYIIELDKILYRGIYLKSHNIIAIINLFLNKRAFYGKDFHNISSEILKERYGKYYNYYINYLREYSIIDLEGNHQKGVKCRTYSLKEKFYQEDRIRIYVTDHVFIKNWKNRRLEYFVENISNIKEYKSNKNLDIYKDIDKNVISMLTNDLYYVNIDHASAEKRLKYEYENNLINYESFCKNTISIDNLKDGTIFHTLDKFGRFHTNFTILKSNIRNNDITIDGYMVDEIDIKNSHPLHLTIIMKEMGFDKEYREEYLRFEESVKSGNIYSELEEITGKTRSQCKKIIYKVLFGKNSLYGGKKCFYDLYPNIWNWICSIKENESDHKILSHKLQRLESDLIFNRIVPAIKEACSSIHIFTVHDSIYFPIQYKDIIEQIFNKFLQERFV